MFSNDMIFLAIKFQQFTSLFIYSEAVVFVSYITLALFPNVQYAINLENFTWPFRLHCSYLQIYSAPGGCFPMSGHEVMISLLLQITDAPWLKSVR